MFILMPGILRPFIPARIAAVLAQQPGFTHRHRVGVAQVFGVGVDVERVAAAIQFAHEARLAGLLIGDQGVALGIGSQHVGGADGDALAAAVAEVGVDQFNHV